MSQSYDYPIANTLNGTWNKLRLEAEILNSDDIEKVLEGAAEVGAMIRLTFAAPLSQAEADFLADRIIAQHTGEALKTTPDPVILEPTGDPAKALVIHARTFEAELGEDTVVEFAWTEDRDVQGASFQIGNSSPGDWLRLAFVAPGGGGPELRVLAEGGEACDEGVPIPPSGGFGVVSEGTAVLPAGVPIRVTYHSTASSGEKPTVWVAFRMWR